MPVLRKSFSFSGYWLTPPPNTSQNTWAGKRKILEELGFGFVLLARGRAASTIQTNAQENGMVDAREAAKNAKQEGFAVGSVVFLDVEEGGRLPLQFHAYLRSWVDELARLGFRPGVYSSGMPVNDENGRKILASDDIRSHMGERNIVFWVLNDTCPPSRGCASVKLLWWSGAPVLRAQANWTATSRNVRRMGAHSSGQPTVDGRSKSHRTIPRFAARPLTTGAVVLKKDPVKRLFWT